MKLLGRTRTPQGIRANPYETRSLHCCPTPATVNLLGLCGSNGRVGDSHLHTPQVRAGFAAQFYEDDVVATGYGGHIQDASLGITARGTLRFDRHAAPEDGCCVPTVGYTDKPMENPYQPVCERHNEIQSNFKHEVFD